jgi:fibronectin-binding autotransporter adhesin
MRVAALRFAALGTIVSVLLAFGTTAGAGTTYYWYGSDSTLGGAGTWIGGTADASWSTSTDSYSGTYWPSTTNYDAYFGGDVGGAVSLGGIMTAGRLDLATSGYAFSSATISLANGISTSYFSSAGTIGSVVRLLADQTWDIGAGGTLVVGTATGRLSGTCTLTKTGSGTLSFLNTNTTYSGNLTLSDGWLTYAASTSFGSATGTLTLSGGTLASTANTSSMQCSSNIVVTSGKNTCLTAVGASTVSRFSGSISGSGTLTAVGPMATMWLSGNNSAFSGTFVADSYSNILLFSSNSASGSANATWIFNQNARAGSLNGVISLGALSGTNSNCYLGAQNTAYVVYSIGNLGVDTTYAGHIYDGDSPAGSSTVGVGVQKVGSGVLTLTGDSSYDLGTLVSGGTLCIGAGGASGSITGTVSNSSVLAFNRSDNFTFTGSISGSGTVSHVGSGTLTLTGNNNPTGGTYILNGGMLQIGDGVATGCYLGGPLNPGAGALRFNAAGGDAITIAADIGGSAAATSVGAGTVSLTGNNTYTGTTTINAGVLQIGNGATTGSLAGNVYTGNTTDGTGTLAFNRWNASSYDGVISGDGAVMHTGAGTATLSQTHTYTGATTVNAGTLRITGSIASSSGVSVNGGGSLVLAGGTVGAVSVAGGGAIAGYGTAGSVNVDYYGAVGGTTSSTWGGQLSVASLTLGGLNTLNFGNVSAYTSTAAIIVTQANSLTWGGGITVNLYGAAPTGSGTAHLLQYSGSSISLNCTVGTITFANSRSTYDLATSSSGSINYLNLVYGSDYPYWTGLGNATWSTATQSPKNWKLASAGTGTDYIEGDTVLFDDRVNTGTTTFAATVTLGMNVSPTSVTFNNSGSVSYVVTGGYGIGGAATVTKNGSGTVTIANVNSYTGATAVNTGALVFGADGATGTGDLSVSSATLSLGSYSGTSAVVTITSGVVTGTGTLTSTSGFSVCDSSISAALAGSVGLTKSGFGTVTLTGANTYTGTTTVDAGTLQIGDGAATGSLGGDVAVTGDLVFNRTGSYSFDHVISGTGPVSVIGGGTLTLSADSTHTGVFTISAGNTLQVGAGGPAGSLASGTIANSGALVFNRSGDCTLSSALSGTGSLSKIGSGAVSLPYNNLAYSGPVTLSEGMLVYGAASSFGSGLLTLSGGTLATSTTAISLTSDIFVDSAKNSYVSCVSGGTVVRLGGNISGSGTLSIVAPIYNFWLQGNNSQFSGTFVADSYTNVLLFSGNANSGSGSATWIFNQNVRAGSFTGTLSFGALSGTNSDCHLGAQNTAYVTYAIGALGIDTTYAGHIYDGNSSAGSSTVGVGVRKIGSGVLTLTGDSNYDQGTTVAGGTLCIGAGGASGSITGNVTVTASVLAFNRSDNFTFTGSISGSGTVSHVGSGTLTLTGRNTPTGGTQIVNGATLQIGDGVATGCYLSGPLYSGTGAVVFNATSGSTITVASAISGSATVTSIGWGTATLSGSSTYTSATNVYAGVLQIGAGGSTGALASPIFTGNGTLGTGTLVFNRSNAYSYDSVISGDGAVMHNGSGTTTLSQTHTYTGATTVNAGTLRISGSIVASSGVSVSGTASLALAGGSVGSVFVASGATLAGYGTAGSANVDTSGALGGTTSGTWGGQLSVAYLTLGGVNNLNFGNVDAYASTTAVDVTQSGGLSWGGLAYVNVYGTVSLGTGTAHLVGFTGGLTGSLAYTLQSYSFANAHSTATLGTSSSAGTTYLDLTYSLDSPYWTGLGNKVWSTASQSPENWKLQSNNAATNYSTGDFVVFDDRVGASAATVTLGESVNPSSMTFNNSSTTSYTLSDGGAGYGIGGAASVTLNGAGLVTLACNNTYTGATTINAGTLCLGSGGTVGSIAGDIVNNGALVFNRSDAYALVCVISGSGSVAQTGSGTFTFSRTNTYTGTTYVSNGVLLVSGVLAAMGSGNVSVSGGTLNLSSHNTPCGAVTLTGGVITSGTLNSTGGFIVSSGSISTKLAGSVSLTKSTAGTVTLSGANIYTGATYVNAGALVLQGAATTAALGTASVTDIAAGRLVFDYTSDGSTTGSSISDQVKSILTAGYNGGSNSWATGVIRSTLANSHSTDSYALGWSNSMATSAVTVKVVLYGDATMDGTVNIYDLGQVLANYNKAGVWATGDFNYDGTVNIYDLGTVLANYNKSISLSEMNVNPSDYSGLDGQGVAALQAAGVNVVPEPGTLALLIAGAIGLLVRAWRKRRSV